MKSYKTEILLSPMQEQKVKQTLGVCRYCYNFFIAQNQEFYNLGLKYKNAKSFSVWFNNDYLAGHPELLWIKNVSSKSVKQAFINADKSFVKFFKKQSEFPKFKKKKDNNSSMYFVQENSRSPILCERHRIKIPTLGWVRLKEKGYIPTDKIISSGTVSFKAGRYYVSVLVKNDTSPTEIIRDSENQGIGIDLGVKETAVLSNGNVYKNINKSSRMKKLNKKLKREQRKLSRKLENKKKCKNSEYKNLEKQTLRIQILHQKITNIKDDFQNKMISDIIKMNPHYIVLEDLNVRNMLKNKHLSKAIQEQRFYYLKSHLIEKCHERGIEVRLVDRFYPSSKICHTCGQIKSDLKLSDRLYKCDCGNIIDRDLNAALNLRDAKTYKIA